MTKPMFGKTSSWAVAVFLLALSGAAAAEKTASKPESASSAPARSAPAKSGAPKVAPSASPTAAAGETTLKGEMTCAKCGLHEAAKCQNVLRVKAASGKETRYYLQQNAVAESEHEKVCGASAPATVTGKVTEEGGKKVVTATSIKFD